MFNVGDVCRFKNPKLSEWGEWTIVEMPENPKWGNIKASGVKLNGKVFSNQAMVTPESASTPGSYGEIELVDSGPVIEEDWS